MNAIDEAVMALEQGDEYTVRKGRAPWKKN